MILAWTINDLKRGKTHDYLAAVGIQNTRLDVHADLQLCKDTEDVSLCLKLSAVGWVTLLVPGC